jgi:hypothetical protein
MKKFEILMAAAAVGMLAEGVPRAVSQKVVQSDDILNRQVMNVNMVDTTIDQALLQALIKAGVPGGIAVPSHCGALPRHSFTPAKLTLRGLLDAIASAEPGYTWEVRDGVVNLVSHDGISVFLRTMIPKLEINKAVTLRGALNELLAIPEVQNQGQHYLGFRLMQGFAYASGPQGAKPTEAKKLSLSATNLTVRDALNAIASTHGSAVWILTQSQCKGRRIYSIDFVAK